jgi:hypothetical protein
MSAPIKPVEAKQPAPSDVKPVPPKSGSSRRLGPVTPPPQPPDFDFSLAPTHQVTSEKVRQASIQDRPGEMTVAMQSVRLSGSVFLSDD